MEQLENAITQQEFDLNDLNDLLKEDPENEEILSLKKEAENTLETLKKQYEQYRLTISSTNQVTKLTNNSPIKETIEKKEYKQNEQVIAWSQRDNGWFSAMITRPTNNQMYWVRFGPRDNQLVSIDKIKPISELNTIQLSTVDNSKIKIRKIPKQAITELPKWTKPKPNDSEKDLLLKKKKRHQLKSLMKQQKEEEELESKKNNWKNFASKLKK